MVAPSVADSRMEEHDKPIEQDVEAKLRDSRRLLAELDTLLERGRSILKRGIRVAVLKDQTPDPA